MTETNTVALVTGANKGIGKEIARQLLAAGVTVLLGARDPERGRTAATELGACAITMDVTDQASVEAAAKLVDQDYGRLDILVNNAGVNLERGVRPSELSADVMRQVYETNVFGAVRVTNAFVPLLRRSASPRIVNVSSALGSITLAGEPESAGTRPSLLAYNSSKSALNAVTVLHARDLRTDGIAVNAINPGYCATDLNGQQGVLDPAEGAAVAVRLALVAAGGPTGEFRQAAGKLPW
jgi:NAD(P)-dependent dehydrogenase (short-subunit alcohol dehydrogenase family)